MQMGFEEMPTNAWVENSFWNFDSLFQPQQHPARDAHDTFFLTGASPPCGQSAGHLLRLAEICDDALLLMHDSLHVEEHHAIASYGRDAFMSCTNPWHNALLVFQVYDSAAAAPATTSIERLPQDYLETVRHTHERGIDGSRGCFASRAGALFFGVTKRILSCKHQLCGTCPTLEMPTITQVVPSSPADTIAYLSDIAVDTSRLRHLFQHHLFQHVNALVIFTCAAQLT